MINPYSINKGGHINLGIQYRVSITMTPNVVLPVCMWESQNTQFLTSTLRPIVFFSSHAWIEFIIKLASTGVT